MCCPKPLRAVLCLALLMLTVPVRGAEPAAVYEDVTGVCGLEFVHFSGATGEYHFPEISGAGGALLDYDNDGDLDLFLVQGSLLARGAEPADAILPPPDGAPLSDRLFRNDLAPGPDGRPVLRFTDVTAAAGFAAERDHGQGVAAGDYDNDGDIDLYVTNAGANRLWRNRGDGTFEDATEAAGAGDLRWSVPAAFFDADGDGDLDLFVGNYVDYAPARNVRCLGNSGVRDYCGPTTYPQQPDRLLRNRGDGTFEDATARAGLDRAFGPALGVAADDFDGDGRTDLYVANDGAANQLWIQQADGTFRDEALLRGAALNADGKAEASMGVAAGDFDDDGDDDVLVTHLERETNTFFVNDGAGLFHDGTVAAGLAAPSWRHTGFGAAWTDFDLDGDLDLLVVNGAVYSIQALRRAGDPFPFAETDQLYENPGPAPGEGERGGGSRRFVEVTEQAGEAFARPAVGRGVILGDLDNDGDDDAVVSNNSGAARVLLNRAADRTGHHWIGLRAVVPTAAGRPPRDALGATLRVSADGLPPRHRRVHTEDSYASARDPRVRVGLGPHAGPVDVEVTWPDGTRERFPDLAADRYHLIEQGGGLVAERSPRASHQRRASRPPTAEPRADTTGPGLVPPSGQTPPPANQPHPPEP